MTESYRCFLIKCRVKLVDCRLTEYMIYGYDCVSVNGGKVVFVSLQTKVDVMIVQLFTDVLTRVLLTGLELSSNKMTVRDQVKSL